MPTWPKPILTGNSPSLSATRSVPSLSRQPIQLPSLFMGASMTLPLLRRRPPMPTLLSVSHHLAYLSSIGLGLLTPLFPDTADSADSAPIATAIARGLAAGHTPERPGYWLHLTGTGMLMWYDARHGRFGEAPVPEQTYRDVDDIDKLVLEIPDEAIHRKVDKIVQAANSDSVRVAIIAPPAIYDQGSGQVNTRSIQVPDLVRATLNHGFGPIAGAGLAEWDNVNVQDLGDLYVKLADATQDPSKQSNEEIFGRNGYFFALGGTHKWSDVTRWIVEEATKHGSLAEPVTRAVSLEEVTQWEGIANVSWGWNSKSVAQRAKKYLGWEPKGRPLRDVIAGLVDDEAKLLSLKSKA